MVLERDGYLCQIRGKRCTVKATEVDHIMPIVAGGALFDPANLRAACKSCNSGRVSRERADNGWRSARTRITLVYGPPGAGKSTFVAEHRQPGDLVVDYDLIAESLGSSASHGHDPAMHAATMAARNAILRQLRRGESPAERAWIISTRPDAPQRFPHHHAELIDPGADEVRRRAIEAGRPAQWLALIDEWYAASSGGGRRAW